MQRIEQITGKNNCFAIVAGIPYEHARGDQKACSAARGKYWSKKYLCRNSLMWNCLCF